MFNKNYLNHDFESCHTYGLKDWICTKCKIIIYYEKDDLGDSYNVIKDTNLNGFGEIDEELFLTCDEIIIRGLIE